MYLTLPTTHAPNLWQQSPLQKQHQPATTSSRSPNLYFRSAELESYSITYAPNPVWHIVALRVAWEDDKGLVLVYSTHLGSKRTKWPFAVDVHALRARHGGILGDTCFRMDTDARGPCAVGDCGSCVIDGGGSWVVDCTWNSEIVQLGNYRTGVHGIGIVLAKNRLTGVNLCFCACSNLRLVGEV